MSSIEEHFPAERMWDYENGFYLTSDVSRLGKLLAHFELYRLITELPGQVVELGVYKGASLVRLATFRELLETTWSRKIVGFDAFGKFPRGELTDADADFIDRFEQAGGDGFAADDILAALHRKNLGNVELVEGDVHETIPRYLEEHPELRIALLHLDMDVHAPTATALELLYPRVVSGGLVVVDDYATVAGATDAIDDYFAGSGVTMRKLPVSHIPAYCVKPEEGR